MREINRYFSREFKINAVQLVTEKKMSVRQVAEELDIPQLRLSHFCNSLYRKGKNIAENTGHRKSLNVIDNFKKLG
jgi:transposase-like protein